MLNRYLYLPLRLPQACGHVAQALRDPLRKSLPTFVAELARYSIDKKDPAQYLYGLLYRRGVANPSDYLSHHEYRRLRALVTRPDVLPLFKNKLLFQRAMEAAGIAHPKCLGYVEDGVFIRADGSKSSLATPHDFEALARVLLGEGRSSFFAKQLENFGGKGAFKVTHSSDFAALFRNFRDSPYIFQDTIEQHPAIAAFHPESLNTMRLVTCIGRDDEIRMACGYMRFGVRDAVVDNSSSGGFMVGIDLQTGRLAGPGITAFRAGGQVYERHPDSGLVLEGFRIPMFADSLDLVRRAADAVRYPLVGWDVALGTDRPIIVEGNENPDYFDDEITDRPYKHNPVMRRFIDELTGGRWL